MARQWIQNQRSGPGENGVFISEREQRTNSPSLSTFASNLDCQPDQRLKNVRIVFGYLAENALKHRHRPSDVSVNWADSHLGFGTSEKGAGPGLGQAAFAGEF